MSQTKSILDFWPISSPPRPQQIKALEWLASQKSKNLIIEAPVGSGKSLIGVTYSRWVSQGSGNSYILTPQRVLQEQYTREFTKNEYVRAAALYGRGNYACERGNMTCEFGSMLKPKCSDCPASTAKQKVITSPNAIMNYNLALLNFEFSDSFKKRKLLVLDECHNIESILTEYDSFTITMVGAIELGIKWKVCTDIIEARDWLKEVYGPQLRSKLEALELQVAPMLEPGYHVKANEIKMLRDYLSLAEQVEKVAFICTTSEQNLATYYVLCHSKVQMSFKPLHAKSALKRLLLPSAEQTLFMSSTILGKDGFCADLGLDPSETSYISLDSEFPVENRQVVFIPITKMNFGWDAPNRSQDRKDMLDAIINLCEMHKEESGVIHTANFAVSEWLVSELEKRRKFTHDILHHNPSQDLDRGVVINSFMNMTKPSLLISPSVTEGLDLKYDLGRFAIFVKVPYPYLGDQWVKRRMELSNEWYQRQALISIIQGGGRVVRAADDQGMTYILDASWQHLYNNMYNRIPDWWKAAYQTLN